MKLIKIDLDHMNKQEWTREATRSVLAIGYFDGVHKGHQTVIKKAINEANVRGIEAAVMTFFPHPKEVLGNPEVPMRYLTPFDSKIERLKALGVDRIYAVRFTPSFSKLTPQQFVDDFIVSLQVEHVVAGFDFTYGIKGAGTMEQLGAYANKRFTYSTIQKVTDEDEKISSTRIRQELEEGNVQKASFLLGYPYKVKGEVIHGDARGRLLGFPTANVSAADRYHIPKTGVYVVAFYVKGNKYNGMANVGYKPTFVDNLPEPSVEVNLFHFAEDIYGEIVEVEFLKWIRAEQKFNGIDEIKAQLTRDKETSLRWLEENIH
ncbi:MULTISPECIES: bifunctional riboflavin kinase/FAD synthetase [Bacillaceae]|uniref:Riboflavin biosynthesis protein n=1 Tax=Alkalicoccobacillus plakortidis TaxID=444060 RepID=A0A9D5DQT0_9BACI|nr:bifunctional riboflavin kinase/FAD synthetase [Alkalicoccobacillus plakortidis]KQL58674.1 riboflavin biosynthesis protein RibF [Alkalicoccobacillus plakortidis]